MAHCFTIPYTYLVSGIVHWIFTRPIAPQFFLCLQWWCVSPGQSEDLVMNGRARISGLRFISYQSGGTVNAHSVLSLNVQVGRCAWRCFQIKQRASEVKGKCEIWQDLRPRTPSTFIKDLNFEDATCKYLWKGKLSHCWVVFAVVVLTFLTARFWFSLCAVLPHALCHGLSLSACVSCVRVTLTCPKPMRGCTPEGLWSLVSEETESGGFQLALLQWAGIQEWCLVVFSGWEACHLASIVRWPCHRFLHAGKERSSSVSCG